MKTLTVKQPWASLMFINNGYKPKDIENRTWKTNFRGKVLIHVGASFLDLSQVLTDEQFDQIHGDMRYNLITKKFPTSAIIGSVEIVDCVINHSSIWAEKAPIAEWMGRTVYGAPRIYNWVLANPILFDKPILNIKGKLSFWDYPIELCHVCRQPTDLICEKCDEPYCENHKAVYDQFNQIDYDCCSECAEQMKFR